MNPAVLFPSIIVLVPASASADSEIFMSCGSEADASGTVSSLLHPLAKIDAANSEIAAIFIVFFIFVVCYGLLNVVVVVGEVVIEISGRSADSPLFRQRRFPQYPDGTRNDGALVGRTVD